MPRYLGIDLGTTGLKAVLVDERGDIAGIGYRGYPLDIPRAGYAEQQPEGWHSAMCAAIADVLHATGIPAADIRGVGLSGQMHGLVMLDADRRVLCPAILHCDGRAFRQKRDVIERVGIESLGQWVQNQVHSGFQALSLLWMRENRPALYARMRHALLPKDYLRMRLTAETGLLPGTPVAFGGGDQTMQAVGNGLLRPGSASVNLGTSGQVFLSTAEPLYDPKLRAHTFCHAPENTWYVMGAVLNACLAFNWFLENVLKDRDFAAMDAEAESVKPGADGLLFLPYLAGERTPHMNERARGAFLGLTLAHGRADMVRAVLEGVAYSLRDALEVVRGLGLPIGRMVVSGGGARSALWRQIVSDVFEMPLYVSRMREQAGLGAALCAQVACRAYATLDEACEAVVRYEPEPVLPDAGRFGVYRESFARYREAYARNASLFETMSPGG